METETHDTIQRIEPDMAFAAEVTAMPGGEHIKNCFACGTCAAGCPVTAVHPEYNCRKIIREVLLGMRESVLASPLIWYCVTCYRCSARCPQEVNFADIMRVLRYLAVKGGYASPGLYEGVSRAEKSSQTARKDMIAQAIRMNDKLMPETGIKGKA